MSENKIHLSPTTRQSISSALMNFVSTIDENEDVEMKFKQTEEDGKCHIELDATKKSKTPDIHKTMELVQSHLDVKIGRSQ